LLLQISVSSGTLSLCYCTYPYKVIKKRRGNWKNTYSSVGIATRYGLDGPGRGDIFRTCPDRPWGLPSLLYNGYRVSFRGVKRPGRGVDHPPSSSVRVKERVQLYLYSTSGPSRPILGRSLPFFTNVIALVLTSQHTQSKEYFTRKKPHCNMWLLFIQNHLGRKIKYSISKAIVSFANVPSSHDLYSTEQSFFKS
jgi:hypothetical protein